MYENCQKKWINIWKLKAEDGDDAPIPKGKEPDADKYQGKWSDANAGSSQFGGWNPAAYDRLEEISVWIEAERKKDEEAGYVKQQHALDQLRKKKGITTAAPEGKKSKRGKKKAPKEPIQKKIKRRKE